MQQGNKPFPPYGAILNQYLQLNIPIHFCPYIFCGDDAWKEATNFIQQGMSALCLPPNTSPDEYYWPVKGLSLIVFDTGNLPLAALMELTQGLLTSGAKIAWVQSTLCPEGQYFCKT